MLLEKSGLLNLSCEAVLSESNHEGLSHGGFLKELKR